ncbi:LptE family protein [Candidatus Dependentiae bacterium]|nr:LptE family protein [Candidatus Dependentiae bacterium]
MKLRNISLILIIILLSGCGYQFLPNMPEHLKTTYVPVFKNNTIQFGIGSNLTNELINELNLDGTLKKVSKDKADSEFKGEVIEFRQVPVSFYEDKTVKEYRIFVKIYIEFWDIKKSKKIWSGNLSRNENYIVRQYLSQETIARSGVFYSKEEAISEIVKGLSRDIVSRTVEGW